jgi:long-chain acyl-CoA synthetase
MKKSKWNNDNKRKLRNKREVMPWEKFYPKGVTNDLAYPQNTMVGYLLDSVSRHPELVALEFYGSTYTYRELYERIRAAAASLKSQGVKCDDKVAMCMPNTPQALILFYAINMVGAIALIIHPLSGESEIERFLNESGVKFLLTLDLTYEKIHNIADKTPLEKIVVASAGDGLKNIKKFIYRFRKIGKTPKIELTDNIMTWNEFINYGYGYDGEIVHLRDKDDPAVILYSGGTSGDPKGIVLSNYNFNSLALSCHKMIEQSGEGESILAILPIFHGFGLGVCIHTTLGCGMRVVLVPQFNPKEFGKLISKYKVSIVCAVPTLFESLTKTKLSKKSLEYLKCAISGGDFMSSELKNRVDKYFHDHGSSAEVRIGYGLTEASAAICVTPTGKYKEGSIGIPFPGTRVKIVKFTTHDEQSIGKMGELCISGPTVMMGYLNNLEETIQSLQTHEDGRIWLHTGDAASMDADGFIYFKQRIKRMIVSNGFNLYPSYIETVINSHPLVFTSTVIGIPDPKKMQVAKAYIVLNDGVKPTKEIEKSIKEHCQKNLAKYSLPSEYEFRSSLPKTLVGKVAYTKLEDGEKEVEEEKQLSKKDLKKLKKLEEQAKKILDKIAKIKK